MVYKLTLSQKTLCSWLLVCELPGVMPALLPAIFSVTGLPVVGNSTKKKNPIPTIRVHEMARCPQHMDPDAWYCISAPKLKYNSTLLKDDFMTYKYSTI